MPALRSFKACWHMATVWGSEEDQGNELVGAEATAYRGMVARLNFLAQDRPDIRYAVKESSRWMARPREGHWGLIKRIGRYLRGVPRLLQKFVWQQQPENVETFTDSDWVGCQQTRKSTTGGCILVGSHLIKLWSTTQRIISFISGEAEHYSVVKAVGMGLGVQ